MAGSVDLVYKRKKMSGTRRRNRPADTFSDIPVQFALTVPKRAFPKATQRNRIRRQMREAYRLNKPYLFETLAQGEEQFAWMLIYIAKEGLPYLEMEKAMQKLIKRFIKQVSAD